MGVTGDATPATESPMLTGMWGLLYFAGCKLSYLAFFDRDNHIVGCTVSDRDIIGFVVKVNHQAVQQLALDHQKSNDVRRHHYQTHLYAFREIQFFIEQLIL